MLGSNRFNAGQIDNQWTEEIKAAFIDWIKKHPAEPQYSKAELEKFLEKRTW